MLSVLSVCSSSSPNFCPPSHLTCPSGRTTCLWRTFVSRPSEREFPCAHGFPQKPLPVTSVRSFSQLVSVRDGLFRLFCFSFCFGTIFFCLFRFSFVFAHFVLFCSFCLFLFCCCLMRVRKRKNLPGRCATFRSMM